MAGADYSYTFHVPFLSLSFIRHNTKHCIASINNRHRYMIIKSTGTVVAANKIDRLDNWAYDTIVNI